MKKLHFLASVLALASISSCQNDELVDKTPNQLEVHDKIVNVTNHDGRPFSTGGTSTENL